MLAQRNALVWLMVSVFVCSVSTPCQPKFTCQTKFTQTSRVGNAPCLCGTWHLAPLTTRFPLLWARCVGAQVGSVSLCSRSHQYGRVKDVRLAKDKRGKGRGFGYVEFEDEVGGFPAALLTVSSLTMLNRQAPPKRSCLTGKSSVGALSTSQSLNQSPVDEAQSTACGGGIPLLE